MNSFGFRYVRDGMNYRAEYRLAHWSGFKVIRDSRGDPVEFRNPMDAALKAATELVNELNSTPAFWRGPDGSEARAAAEKLFTRNADGGENETAGCAVG